jgi:hypothetical protein
VPLDHLGQQRTSGLRARPHRIERLVQEPLERDHHIPRALIHDDDANASTQATIAAGDTVLATFTATKAIQSIIYSSPSLVAGDSYQVSLGGTPAGTAVGGLTTAGSTEGGTVAGSATAQGA